MAATQSKLTFGRISLCPVPSLGHPLSLALRAGRQLGSDRFPSVNNSNLLSVLGRCRISETALEALCCPHAFPPCCVCCLCHRFPLAKIDKLRLCPRRAPLRSLQTSPLCRQRHI